MTQIPFSAVIFDVDGTLFQTEKIAIPAFRRVFERLREDGQYTGDTPSDDQITNVFGMTIPEVWETLLPDASMDVRDKANEILAKGEIELMESGEGELYPRVKEVLEALHKEGVHLFVASNGEKRYVETVIETQGLAPLFTKLYSAGEYKTETKDELVAKLLQNHDIESAAMVGDRKSDMQAGRANGLTTIGCDFGFAHGADELAQADVIIKGYDELRDALVKEGQDIKSRKVKKNGERV